MRSTFILLLLAMLMVGCANSPRVEAPRPAGMLKSHSDEEKIPIHGFTVESHDQPFELTGQGSALGGEKRLIYFPKQAREYLAEDINAYINSRFKIDPSSDVEVRLNLAQAYFYNTWTSNPMAWVPFVGVVTSLADMLQQSPNTFIVEVKATVAGKDRTNLESDVFIRRVEVNPVTTAQNPNKAKEIFQRQIQSVRTELFERLDSQLMTSWQDGQGGGIDASRRSTALLASELARLDTALADGKLSKEEHSRLVQAAKEQQGK